MLYLDTATSPSNPPTITYTDRLSNTHTNSNLPTHLLSPLMNPHTPPRSQRQHMIERLRSHNLGMHLDLKKLLERHKRFLIPEPRKLVPCFLINTVPNILQEIMAFVVESLTDPLGGACGLGVDRCCGAEELEFVGVGWLGGGAGGVGKTKVGLGSTGYALKVVVTAVKGWVFVIEEGEVIDISREVGATADEWGL
jgi:hypothetical protein